jgi:hypothetical protein
MIENENRFDFYFSYWIILWFIISLFIDIYIPFTMLIIIFISTFVYIYNKNCKIFESRKYYIILGNYCVFILKYLLIVYTLLYKYKKINIIKELYISIVLFIIYCLYYYILTNKLYFNDFSMSSKLKDGPIVNLFSLILNNR